jgi:exonuclease SbcC
MEVNVKKGLFLGRMEDIEKRISERDTLISQQNVLIKDINVYKNLSKAFGSDGIPAIIVENIVEDLKNYTNSLLNTICYESMRIDFITQKQTGSGWKEQFDIKIYMGGSELDFDDLSGGEQVRVSIALRLAVSQLLTRRVGSNVRFILFDEVDQSLDKAGIDALADTIEELSKTLKILVITHNETMKGKFENIITIQKGPNGSVLEQ